MQGQKENTTANTGFASGGVTCKLEALCFYSSSVQVDSFVLRNPPERKARNRYETFVETNCKQIKYGLRIKKKYSFKMV